MKADSKINKFSLKSRFALLTLVTVLICITVGGIYLVTRDVFHSENPIQQINENRSQILVTGEKYSLSHEQEQEYMEQEQKREEIRHENKDKIEEQSGISSNTEGSEEESIPGGSGDSGTAGGNGDNADDGKEDTKLPRIECSLKNGQHVVGNYLSFDVRAKSYKNETISSFNMIVTINGNRVRSTGTSGSGWVTFKDDGNLIDGSNTIVVQVTDDDGNIAKVTYIIDVDKNAERPKAGTVTVIADAPSVGLGTLFKREITVYEGENVSAVMLRAFEGSGYKASFTGSVNHGFYLNRVYRKGMMAGWTIDRIHPLVKAHLDDMNASYMGTPPPDSLGEKDIYGGSGWVVSYNGWYGNGMSTEACSDGDVIRLSFTLHMGSEYNGVWPDCCL